jgi:hypothetical protein
VRQNSPNKKRKPVKFGPAWSILFLPLLPLLGAAAALSIPYSRWKRNRSRRQEQLFEDTMRSQGRTLQWDELENRRKVQKNGCVVVEWLSFKGPSRWWWIGDGISTADFRKVTEEGAPPNLYVPIDKAQWQAGYTGPGGKATLISATQEQKKSVTTGGFSFKEGVDAVLIAPFLTDSVVTFETTSWPS